MKQFARILMFGALATGMMACSNDDAPDSNGGKTSANEGYIAVNIQLPTTPVTRAQNDNFDDGDPKEYKVSNAALVIYKGTSEADATMIGAYDLIDDSEKDEGNSTTDNITATYKMTAKVATTELNANEKLYALALVNYTSAGFSIDADNNLKLNDTPVSGKYATLLNRAVANKFYNGDNTKNASLFFMTNAPMSTKKGGTSGNASDLTAANVETLTQFDASKIYSTKEQAKANPAADIYVERAVSKVSLSWTPTKIEIGEGKELDIALEHWTVNNIEPTSYIIRNLGFISQEGSGARVNDYLAYTSSKLANNNFRFVGHSDMGATSLHPNVSAEEEGCRYRTYWCIDPHYSTPLSEGENDYTTVQNEDWKKADHIFYPHENTFNVQRQAYRNTTRVVLKAKVTVTGTDDGSGTFYILNGDQSTIYVKKTDVESFFIDKIITDPLFLNTINDALNNDQEYKYKTEDLILTFNRDTDGIYKLANINYNENGQIKVGEIFKELPSTDFETLITSLNNKYKFEQYLNGECYYDLRIMHFASNTPANDLAPWTAPANGATDVNAAYGNDTESEKNYLGRYGIVRNNWYDLNVTNVKKIGKPVVPNALVSTSDDNNIVEKYISFKINILSWAKRTNDYELQ